MSAIVTLIERKRARTEEIRAGIASLRGQLADYGKTHGGRFWLYGSAVTGRIHFESDIDILTDFSPERTALAIDFVETACATLRLKADVQPKTWCTPSHLKKISATALVVP